MQLTLSKAQKINGQIKQKPEDFLVEEAFDFIPTNGKYTHCLLTKNNYDTFKALAVLSKELGTNPNDLNIAGTKDKFAITTQRIAVLNLSKEKIRKFKHSRLKLKFLGFGEKTFLGDLKGNSFVVTIRNVATNENKIKALIGKNLYELNNHFPNFFGEQRFGGTRPITHIIGKHLLKRDFKSAVLDYISLVFKNEPKNIKFIRRMAKKYPKKALALFPKQYHYERIMLEYLIKNNDDYIGAFRKLPINLRIMFVHAYQAYLFNMVLNNLLKKKAINYNLEIPIFTGRMKLPTDKLLLNIMKDILKKERLNLNEFRFRDFVELDSSNVKRIAFQKFSSFKILNINKDELNKGKNKITISFYLPKGSYATTLLRELFFLGY